MIITLRMEYTSAFDLEYYNSLGYESYQGTWEREIDFDSDDYDPNLGVAYADLLRVEDSFTSPSHSFLNYADRDASSSIGSSASRLYLGLIDFPSLQTTYQTFTQAGLQTGGPIAQSFTYVDQYYPSDRGFTHPFGTNPDGTVTSYWYGNIDYSGTDPDINTSIEYLDNPGNAFTLSDSNRRASFYENGVVLDIWSIKTAQAQSVPEPSTAIAMGLLGIVGFAGNRRRRRQVSAA